MSEAEKGSGIIHLVLETNDVEDVEYRIHELLQNTGDLFRVLEKRVITNFEALEVADSDFAKFLCDIKTASLVAARAGRDDIEPKALFESLMPDASEDVLIKFVKRGYGFIHPHHWGYFEYDYQNILEIILRNNKGVTKKVLAAVVDLVSEKEIVRGSMKINMARLTKLVVSHLSNDEETLWELAKNATLKSLDCIIPHANEEMLEWIEKNRKMSKGRKEFIRKRRQELSINI